VILRIGAIALNTFREAIRNKVLYLLLLFAIGLIAFALALGQMSLHEELRVTRDLGLGGIALFGVLIAIFVGVNLVYKELDKKTVFSLIPKPIRRFEFVLGKYAGMVLTLAVQVAIMSAVLFLVLWVQGSGIEEPVVRAIVLLFVEVMVITSVAVLFSTFASPILSGAFTLGLYVIGRSTPELRELAGKLHAAPLRALAGGALRLVPDLHVFYVSGSMVEGQYASVHGSYVDWPYVATGAAYGLLYAACALALAVLFFARRDFT
jgi:ABC-type transport system involved in multi-copper enzyme maturation permease subunit